MLLLSNLGRPLRKATNIAARITYRYYKGDNFS